LFLTVISLSYAEEKWTKDDGTEDSRVVMRIPAKLAPTKLAILPLIKKDGLPEIARQLMHECKSSFMCFYEEKDAIGKRYRRMDAIGTPFCITIDHQTKEDGTSLIASEYSRGEEKNVIPSAVEESLDGKKVNIFIGPEGGFTEQEVAYANENNVKSLSLGKTILRAETAAIVSMVLLLN